MISIELRITSGLRDLERDLQRQEYLPLNLLSISRCCIPPPTPLNLKQHANIFVIPGPRSVNRARKVIPDFTFGQASSKPLRQVGVTSRKGIPRTPRRSLFT